MMRSILKPFSLCVGGLVMGAVFTGCASGPQPSTIQPIIVPAQTPPGVSGREYVLRSGDVLEVKFYYHPEQNQTVTVRPDGRVLLAPIGEVAAAGTTAEKLGEIIASRYDNLRDPRVSVNVKEFADKRFSDSQIYVGGEVGRPGVLRLKEGMTVLQAIVEAGGFRDTADIEKVILLRPLEENRFGHREINLSKVLTNEDPQSDALVTREDVIFVPRTGIARANLWVQQYIRNLLPFGNPLRFETVPIP